MQKPFDVSDLELRLKNKGLPAVEGLAELAAGEVFAWLKDSMALEAQSNPLYAIGGPVLNALQPLVMSAVKKIDPGQGQAVAPAAAT